LPTVEGEDRHHFYLCDLAHCEADLRSGRTCAGDAMSRDEVRFRVEEWHALQDAADLRPQSRMLCKPSLIPFLGKKRTVAELCEECGLLYADGLVHAPPQPVELKRVA